MATSHSRAEQGREKLKSEDLECSICPKVPKFSDVSHLLTHVSSKSHLHAKFSCEFRAGEDPAAAESLRKYQRWYEKNGIEKLLRDRLAAKDQKKTVRRAARVTASVAKADRAAETELIKADPDAELMRPSIRPPMAYWEPPHNTPSFHVHDARKDYRNHRQDQWLDGSAAFDASSLKSMPSPYTFSQRIDDHNHRTFESSPHETETADSTLPSEIGTVFTETGDEDSRSSKLKGTVWPGMSLFDSATPEQKRKRNQRKDNSVLEQMKATSEAVTPTEFVRNAEDLEVERTRHIYASPSIDGSPPPGPSSRKRKHVTRHQSPSKSGAKQYRKSRAGGSANRTRRGGRTALADVTNIRQTRAATKNAEDKKPVVDAGGAGAGSAVAHANKDVQSMRFSLPSRVRNDGFDIYRDPEPSPGRTESPFEDAQPSQVEPAHCHMLPPLHPLDSNMMHHASDHLTQQHHGRAFGGGMGMQQAPQLHPLVYRQPTTYTTSFLSHATYNPLCTQPRVTTPTYPYPEPNPFNFDI